MLPTSAPANSFGDKPDHDINRIIKFPLQFKKPCDHCQMEIRQNNASGEHLEKCLSFKSYLNKFL